MLFRSASFPFTGSAIISGSLSVTGSVSSTGGFTGSLQGTASYATQALSSSYAISSSYSYSSTSASYYQEVDPVFVSKSASLATTGSNVFIGNQTITGSINTSGSNTLIGSTTLTGSLNISGSTTQIGNNNLYGNTTLSGSIIISGSTTTPATPTIGVYGDMETSGIIKFNPVVKSIDNSISASYIYVSGSTQDLYFSQNGSGYSNSTRLRWLESVLYTGILSGGILSSTTGSTTFNISAGTGIIVTLNASTASAPYPTVQYISWPNYTSQPIINSGSAKITYVGINSGSTVIQQVTPWGSTDINQWDNSIPLGVVLHLSGSVSSGVFNSPQISYGGFQKSDDFLRAFGPLKLSGHVLQPSGSTLSIIKTGGNAWREGANYTINPNHPSTTVEGAITTSKIFRYYISGSTPVIDTGVANAGYTVIDPSQYVNITTGNLTTVTGNNVNNSNWTIQRVFWFPNSPTNAFVVYYGNAQYSTSAAAQAAINTEAFTEAPNTALNAIFVAYIIVQKGCTDLSSTRAIIQQGGLFRNVGGIGGSTGVSTTSLAALSDVLLTSPTYGDLLMYDSNVWYNTKILSGSYTLSGSLVTNDGVSVNSLTASFVSASSITGSLFGTASYASTASYVTTAQTASYVLNAVSSSYALTASYALSSAGGGGGGASTATSSFGITLDGQGGTISTGTKGYVSIPWSGSIKSWVVMANTGSAGSCIQIDLKRNSTSLVGTGNSASLSSQQFASASVSGWTSTNINANDIMEFVVNSATTLSRVTVQFVAIRTLP